MSAMFLLAQETAVGLTEMLEWWHALVAIVSPFILGLATNDLTRVAIKKALPFITAAGVTIITAFVNSDVGAEVLALIPILSAAVHYMYQAYGMIVSLVRNQDLSLNDILANVGNVAKQIR